ncbi:MAG TPA: histidinol-phosphate aminotransferase, partial [Bacteroidota bacterium]|nr:histidinol-phosphate aminotransferase [Bacteroidota bacterium]
MTPLLRPEIGEITEYRLDHNRCRIKLNQNENPFDLPDEIKSEILQRVGAEHWSRYPEFVPRRQMELVSEFAGWT